MHHSRYVHSQWGQIGTPDPTGCCLVLVESLLKVPTPQAGGMVVLKGTKNYW